MDFDGKLTLLACQPTIPAMNTAAGRDAHLSALSDRIGAELDKAGEPVDLVVLPELSSIDYSRTTFSHLDQFAEPLDGLSFQIWRELAVTHNLHVAYGFARAGKEGFFISIGVVGPDGNLVGYYDKLHLAQYGASMEKEYFTRGNHLFIFDIKGFRLAPIICYDIRIPELSRALTIDHNVDVILHCGAYYRDESFHTWHPFAITRALENQVFFLSLNRAGDNFGNSLFCSPWIDEDTPALQFAETGEEFRIVTIEKETIITARQDYSFLKDRLPNYQIRSI